VFVDPDLLQFDEVWAAAGTWNDNFGANPNDIVRVAGGVVTDSITSGIFYDESQRGIYFSEHQFAITPNLILEFNSGQLNVTYEFWVNIDSNVDGVLLTERATLPNEAPGWFDSQIEYSGLTTTQRVWRQSSGLWMRSPIQRGQWQHVVLTYSNSITRTYIDGVLTSSGTVDRTLIPPNNQIYYGLFMAQPITNMGQSSGLSGYLREFRMYDRALSSFDIKAQYEATREVLPTNLRVHLDAGNLASYSSFGTQWKDLSSFGNNATLSGTEFVAQPVAAFQFDSNEDAIISTYYHVGFIFQNPLSWKPGDKIYPSLEESWEIKLGPLSRKAGR
jgi:hypothetical protein